MQEKLKKYLIEELDIKDENKLNLDGWQYEAILNSLQEFFEENEINLYLQVVTSNSGCDDYIQCGFWKDDLLIVFNGDVSFGWQNTIDELVDYVLDLEEQATLIKIDYKIYD